mgnify:CR=1 FL=1
MTKELLALLGPEVITYVIYALVSGGLFTVGSIVSLVIYIAKKFETHVKEFQGSITDEVREFNKAVNKLSGSVTLLVERDENKTAMIRDNKDSIQKLWIEQHKMRNNIHDLRTEMLTPEYVDLRIVNILKEEK